MKALALVAALLLMIDNVSCRSSGAPDSICDDKEMKPNHGVEDQTTSPPYKLTASKSDYSPKKRIQVVLESKASKDKFRGFAIAARDSKDHSLIGEWKNVTGKAHSISDCKGIVTHDNKREKSKVELEWIPPSEGSGKVNFIATVVKTKEVFWIGIKEETKK